MLLYFCCTSLKHAEEIVENGFDDEAFLAVTETSPYVHMTERESHGVVVLGLPVGITLSDFSSHTNSAGVKEYRIPGSVLNRCKRAVWPRS